MIASGSDWSETQLSRARPVPLLSDQTVAVAAPEDVILGKLLSYRAGGSEKHVRDITGILTTKVVEIDYGYLAKHAAELGVNDEWQSILDHLDQTP